jgi:hypothetical protein
MCKQDIAGIAKFLSIELKRVAWPSGNNACVRVFDSFGKKRVSNASVWQGVH